MATTVYSGNSATSVVHTNASGGNQRVLIYYLACKDETGGANPVYVKYGALTNIRITDGDCRVTVGLKLYYATNNSNTMHMGMAGGGSGTFPDGSHNEPPVPLEGYISDGQTFEITGTQYGNILGYNFIVIDE